MAFVSASKGRAPEPEAILVLGCAGAGKSSFIAAATGADIPIGHGPETCKLHSLSSVIYTVMTLRIIGTKSCGAERLNNEHGRLIMLIDTPGLHDNGLEEIEALRCVTQYLESNAATHIIGIVYLHPIVEMRFTRAARQHLQLLKDICGQKYYPNVVFATSMWDTVPDSKYEELEARETLLRQNKEIWGEVILKGAYCERFSGTAESSKKIVGLCLRMARPPPLQIMSELRAGTMLEATTACATLIADVRPRESFARWSSMHGDEEGAKREAAIKEEVERLRAKLEEDPKAA